MKLSLAYLTNREICKFEWFADSLSNQIDGIDVEVLIVDLISDYEYDRRNQYFKSCVNNRFEWKLVAPKPCAWQGKYRKTQHDMFAAANARNTAFIHADGDYIVCLDDLSVLSPEYISNAIHAMDNKYVMMGAYRKLKEMVVDSGKIISHGDIIQDSRWGYGSSSGIIERPGSMLFGCSFGVPIEAVEKVNGFDEYFDGLGAEDCDFGIRLNRSGYKTYYNRNALTSESDELHFQPGAFLRKNRLAHTGEEVDWYMVNRLKEQPNRYTTLGTWTNIIEARNSEDKISYALNNMPNKDWATQKAFEEIDYREKVSEQ